MSKFNQHLQSVLSRHENVQDHYMRIMRAKRFLPGYAVQRRENVEASRLEYIGDILVHRRFIIHYQDAMHKNLELDGTCQRGLSAHMRLTLSFPPLGH